VTELNSIKTNEIADPNLLLLVNLAFNAKITDFIKGDSTNTQNYIQNQLSVLKNKTQSLLDNMVKNQMFLRNNSYLFGSNLLSVQFALSNDISQMDMKEVALNNTLTTVDLKDCFQELKQYYNFTADTEFLVMANNYDSLINLDNLNKPLVSDSFAYSIYKAEDRQKLNTDVCSKVKIKTPIQNKTLLNLKLYHNLSDQGIDIYDKNNSAFQDRCFQFVDNATDYDTTIGFRRQNYYQNLTVDCGNECLYTDIDSNDYLECTCNKTQDLEIKSNFNNDTTLFDTDLGDFNMDIVACFYVAFKYPGIFSNIGFYASLTFFLSGLTLSILVNLIHKNILIKSLNSVLYNDCQFFDRKVFSPEEYFNKGSLSEAVQPPPIGTVLKNVTKTFRRESFNENKPLTEVSNDNQTHHSKEDVIILNDNKPIIENNNSDVVNNPIIINNYNLNQPSEMDKEEISISGNNTIINNEAINSIDDELKHRRNSILKDNSHKISLKDYEQLTTDEIIKYDKRGFFTFVLDHVLEGHILIAVFKKSLIEPIFIRVILLVYIISMSFAFNAICFSDDYINKRMYVPERARESFFYSVIYEFPKTIITMAMTTVLEIIARVIIYIPKKYEEEFIEVMQTKNAAKIEEGR
jgi:hypothetical protein